MTNGTLQSAEKSSRGSRLREILFSSDLRFLMEAHSGLSARIVEQEGFEGIWASGLAISASLGLRDRNELSWSQVVNALEFMADSTQIPILADGDTGHGDFNNVRRFVRKLGQAGVAGVCLEDKRFPKSNSFLGERQPLVTINEFTGKIRAAHDAKSESDFCVVARTEAIISGMGIDEALRRGEAYAAAGADALVVHSKQNGPDEILQFMNHWPGAIPVIIVPTTYAKTPVEVFEKAGISTVIWANHNLRACIIAMQRATRQVKSESSVVGLEASIASLDEVFHLLNYAEIEEAELRYHSELSPYFKPEV